ncbi:unnamed protein product [Urochloa decumbens]|uniref:Uncharacterized protein n=1 Tax=Urochloa decumbens TaxID=240449 RepID=A0ABC9BG29_9POAL
MSPLFVALLIAVLLSATATGPSEALNVRGHLLKSKTFLSPPIFLRPGSVSNKWYYGIPFPTGHLALKSFNAELVDEHGVPVPLHETYIHHWALSPFHAAKSGGAAKRPPALLEGESEPACQIEYQVEECSSEDRAKNDCVHVEATKEVLPRGGDIVFGVAHQHPGGIGASLHGEDGRLLCESMPTYGEGQEAGNEAGYIVGMSACYPKPGTATVRDGEALTVVSNYSNERQHTGVMGLFQILVAEHEQKLPAAAGKPGLCFSFPVSWCLPSWLSSNM